MPVRGENADGSQSFAPDAVGQISPTDFADAVAFVFEVSEAAGPEIHAFAGIDVEKRLGR